MKPLITEYRSRITDLRSFFNTPLRWIFLDGYSVIIVVLFLTLLSTACNPSTSEPPTAAEPLFQSLSPERTGVTFTNNLPEHPGPHRNQLLYEYFTNGGGVAIGDLNGDGLEDLYFSGNMMYNQLYLNRGGLVFDDITELAGVGGRINTWKTGVTIADVNGDGLLDIYVCYSGDLPLDRRVDELYINKGNDEAGLPRFVESASEYGLANPHSSNQGYFFDYDLDGDLDLFLQTHNVKNVPRLDPEATARELQKEDRVTGNRFYRNDGDRFQDVTPDTGISSSSLTYGLGAGVADFNRDGWMDIYVGNDYSPPDYLYINNKDGTFADKLADQIGHTSSSSMGVDASDINNDGWADIVVVDMLPASSTRLHTFFMPDDREEFARTIESGFHRQYLRNTLQLNNGNDTFSEIGQLAGIHATDWSWAPLVADFDNDGMKDIVITNGILNDAFDRDFLAFKRDYIVSRQNNLQPNDVAYLMSVLPRLTLHNYAFRNRNGIEFEDVSSSWGLDAGLISTGAAYADLDNDGDLDIVLNNINAPASIYENKGGSGQNYLQVALKGGKENTNGIGATVTVYAGGMMQYIEQMPARGYLSSVGATLHFGVGELEKIDSLRVVWPGSGSQTLFDVGVNTRIELSAVDAKDAVRNVAASPSMFEQAATPIAFTHRVSIEQDDFLLQPLLDHAQSDVGPALARADVNGDGNADIFVGGGVGQASAVFLQSPNGTFDLSRQPDLERGREHNDVAAVFVDVDLDGDQDLYVGSGGYAGVISNNSMLQDRLYLNDGAGGFQLSMDALPAMLSSTGAVAFGDVNDDGYPDLFVGGRVVPARYPEPPRSYVLINDGAGQFQDQTKEVAPALETVGMVTSATWQDLQNDGTQELIVAGLWMPIRVFEGSGGNLEEVTETYFNDPLAGLWTSLHVADLNGDGLLDLVAGNHGLNSRLQASPDQPATMLFGDLDNNGTIDPLLTYFVDGLPHFYPGLDDWRKQVPLVGARFSTYKAYADAQTGLLQNSEILQGTSRLSATHLESTIFIANAGGSFEQASLPPQAQFAPVYAIEVADVNQDGLQDVLLAGNTEEATVRWGRHDANYGVLLLGTASDEFEYVPQVESGLRLKGAVRSLLIEGNNLILGRHGGPITRFTLNVTAQ